MPISAKHGNASLFIPFEHCIARMTKSIAIASVDEREFGRDGFYELWGRGCHAAVMWNQQHIGFQCGGITYDERAFAERFNISGEQRGAAFARDFHHARAIIRFELRVLVICRVGMQYIELHVIPHPLLSGLTRKHINALFSRDFHNLGLGKYRGHHPIHRG